MNHKYIQKIRRNIVNNINLVVTDTENNIIFVSDHYAKIMGYKPNELIGKSPSILKHYSTNNSLFKHTSMWEDLEKYAKWNGILKNQKKNSDAIFFETDIYKDFDNQHNHIGYHAIYTDITHTIVSPHKFIFDNGFTETFFASNDELIVICLCESEYDNKQRIIEISKKLSTLIGLDKKTILENEYGFADIISQKSIYYKNPEKLISDYDKGEDLIIELTYTDVDIKKYKLTIVPIHFELERAKIFKLQDITKELKYAEDLDTIIKSKNTFLANLSHEIKTPLNAINGFLTLLQLRENDKEKLDYINIILNSSNHISELANDVIDFTGMDNNKLEIIPREFTPKDIQSTIELFFAKSMEKNIEFTTYISPQLPDIMEQDILRLKQVITNLISNAIKFVDEGGFITINIHYHLGNLYFTIEDNGIGMTKNQIKKIFDPFSQATKDTKMFYGGTGLGLSVVKKIVETMNGVIKVDSKAGVGSTFSVKIPVKSIKEHRTEGKLQINEITMFAPSFSSNKHSIIEQYLMDFTTAKIKKVDTLFDVENSCIIINFEDVDENLDTILNLSRKNKVVLIKKMSVVIQSFENSECITEINLPLMGSKLYNALNTLVTGVVSSKEKDESLDSLHISGNILVADDLDSNRTLIKELLSPYDVTISFAVNGAEAVTKFNQSIKDNKSAFDLILLDMNMPILTGSMVAQKIRKFENQFQLKHTPIVALTANRYNSKADNRLINMDEYLPKPINLKQMLSIIIKYTSNLELKQDFDNFDKIGLLREIKDCFMQNNVKKMQMIIKDVDNHFTKDENTLIKELSTCNNKRQFNLSYNKLMKFLRRKY